MAVRWQIPFEELRGGALYTVNIYDEHYSASPIVLKGGAQPFTTEERNDEDVFIPVRTQSGYLRIVDNGFAADGVTPFNWKTMLPSTDTDRPITLTKTINETTTVVWRGFMQAQNFGGELYGNPQEREYPIHCVLTVLQDQDINYTHTGMENFAYLLNHILNSIPFFTVSEVVMQGGSDAVDWLKKRIDWQNFVSEKHEDILSPTSTEPAYNLLECLEAMCKFWGWTARVHGDSLYLLCADDADEPQFATLTTGSGGTLEALADGNNINPPISDFDSLSLLGNIFASVNNDDYRQLGPGKALITANSNRGDDDIINPLNDEVVKEMKDLGEQGSSIHYNDKYVTYSNDLLTIDQPFLQASCISGEGSFNVARIYQGNTLEEMRNEYINVVRIHVTGGNNVSPMVSLETVYEHNFDDGFFRMYGDVYRYTDKYEDPYTEYFPIGRSYMFARIGIGRDRNNAHWWNGRQWQDTQTFCRISIGNRTNQMFFLFLQAPQASSDDWGSMVLDVSGLSGKLFVDLLGTDNTRVEEIFGERSFEIKDFKLVFTRNPGVNKFVSTNGYAEVTDIQRPTSFGYKAGSGRDEWTADTIFATENAMKFCYGEIVNPDNTFCEYVNYGGTTERPEQHLANRVAAYWATAKRMIDVELKSDAIVGGVELGDITPSYILGLDSTTLHPISISRNWRDSVIKIRMIEI